MQGRSQASSPSLQSEPSKELLLAKAAEIGFSVCGVAPVALELRKSYYLRWIAEGRHGDMAWMARNLERRTDPKAILPEARSIICVGLNYYQAERYRRGRIAKYALGRDYHNIMLKMLKQLCRWLCQQGGANKPYVDTGPVLEKPAGVRAGLGWQAKNTMLINRHFGNWLFLGEVFTTLNYVPDVPEADHCGTCRACIDICPTRAITAPYELDARRCIAYLTIEYKGAIPMEFREQIGDHLFGCDDCLDVCPWNRWAQETRVSEFQSREYPDLVDMLAWTEEEFTAHFRGTPIHRLTRARWLRNICVVLGNIGSTADLPALVAVVRQEEPFIAEHAQWACGRIRARATPASAN